MARPYLTLLRLGNEAHLCGQKREEWILMETSHLCLHQTLQSPNILAHFFPHTKQTHPFPKRNHPASHSVIEADQNLASAGGTLSFPFDGDVAPVV